MKIGSTKNIVIKENFISKENLRLILSSIDDSISWGSNSMAGIPDKVTKIKLAETISNIRKIQHRRINLRLANQ